MKKKAAKSEYEAMLQKSRLFTKKLMEFAFRELTDVPVRMDVSDDPKEYQLTLSSNKMDNNIRILVDYNFDDNTYDVEISDFSEDNFFNIFIATEANSEIQKLIPPAIKKILRDKYLKTRPEIN